MGICTVYTRASVVARYAKQFDENRNGTRRAWEFGGGMDVAKVEKNGKQIGNMSRNKLYVFYPKSFGASDFQYDVCFPRKSCINPRLWLCICIVCDHNSQVLV